jgi:polysaccharide biosynthesis/export protein
VAFLGDGVSRPLKLIRITVGLLLLGSRLPAQERIAANPTQRAQVGDAEAISSRDSVNAADYTIGAQDVLRIDVWKEDQLTRTVPVRPDGKVTLPLVNDVQAAGLTPMELAGVIAENLKKYINSPQVTVTIAQINSRRIYVTGEVMRAGALLMLPNMTVLQALSTCGGFTQFAKTKKIYVLRIDDGKQTKLPFNYNEVIKGKKTEQNIALRNGDVVVVP